jgi:hypothetical protein
MKKPKFTVGEIIIGENNANKRLMAKIIYAEYTDGEWWYWVDISRNSLACIRESRVES